jgi:NCS2 family nucleobase:cation symporter-2
LKRPPTIVYGVDDKPPLAITVFTGLQHVALLSIFLLFPVLLCREAGLSPEKINDVVSLSMLVIAVGAVVQTLSRGPAGSGFLCPVSFSAAYVPASFLALKTGGLSLMFGMTVFAGLVEIGLSRLLRPLRAYFPPEIAGFVVTMIGVTLGTLGLRSVAGTGASGELSYLELGIAAITLGTMIALNVWSKGALRIFCALIGMAVGYLLTAAMGTLPADDLARVHAAPFLHAPNLSHLGWSFDAGLIVPFAVGALAACLRSIGDVTICQKLNDAEWVRPGMRSISGGVMANGLSTLTAGLLGTVGTNTMTSNVSLTGVTGITSRVVAYAIGGIFVLFAFMPKTATIFAIIPGPVVGATLLFVSCLVFINGLFIITSRMLDARRTFVIGLSFMLGLSVDLFPGLFAQLPAGAQLFTSSSLVLGTLSALLLNLVFRLGIRRTQKAFVDPDLHDPKQIEDFLITQGSAWGARRDIIERANYTLGQSIEAIIEACNPQGPLEIAASFDEFNLNISISYSGPSLELPERSPTTDEIIESDAGHRKLAGFLLRKLADRVQATHKSGRSTIVLHFDH